jgi:hypothetical protein
MHTYEPRQPFRDLSARILSLGPFFLWLDMKFKLRLAAACSQLTGYTCSGQLNDTSGS